MHVRSTTSRSRDQLLTREHHTDEIHYEEGTLKDTKRDKDSSNRETVEGEKAVASGTVSDNMAAQSKDAAAAQRPRNSTVCCVRMLDGSDYEFDIDKGATGQQLVDAVSKHLNLSEKDFFSCSFHDVNGIKFWVNPEKKLSKQLKGGKWVFAFEMKFYPTEPSLLRDDFTRYLECLQIRTDIMSGRLPCSFVTHSLLGSYAAQSDLGDYVPEEHGVGIEYLKGFRFAPNQTDELLEKIAELHRSHRGQSPAEAEHNYLDNAKKLAMYGVDLHVVKDSENAPCQVGVHATGLMVYRDKLRINRFAWPKILKIAYKRNNFYIKIRPGEFEKCESTIGFKLSNLKMAKRLWKIAVEHHAFFRLKEPEPSQRTRFALFGSKFRYSGRTLHQTRVANGTLDNRARTFDRGNNRRFQGGMHNSESGVTASRVASEPWLGPPGFSTDRVEQYHQDDSRTATLDLRRGNKKPPVADYDDDRNLSANPGQYDEGQVALLPGSSHGDAVIGYTPVKIQVPVARRTKQHTAGIEGPYVQDGVDEEGVPDGDSHYSGQFSDDGTGRGTGARRQQPGQTVRDEHGNIISNGKPPEGDELPPYQEDHRHQHGVRSSGALDGKWGTYSTTTKTSTRTYTDIDGSTVTEHKTEKDGVIETRIERKQKMANEPEFDYDAALANAILGVIDMDQDLSVEKIEIQTKTETAAK